MTGTKRRWLVHLAAAAEADIAEIVHWTDDRFGEQQARVYSDTILAALDQLRGGPDTAGARARDDIAKGLFTLRVARERRRGRHFLVFRVGRHAEIDVVEVLRVLHDTMDLPRHLPAGD